MLSNIIKVLSGRIITAAALLLFNTLLAFQYSEVLYSQYVFYYSFLGILTFSLSVGLNNSFLVTYKQSDDIEKESVLLEFLSNKILLSIYLSLLFILTLFFIDSKLLIFIVFLSGLAMGWCEALSVVCQATDRFKTMSLAMPVKNVIMLIVLFLLYLNNSELDILLVNIVILISLIIQFLYLIFTLGVPFLSVKINGFDFNRIANSMQKVKHLALMDLSMILMMRTEIWILGLFVTFGLINSKELAHFGLAFNFAFVLPIITKSIVNVVLPYMMEYKENIDEYRGKLVKVLFLSVLFSVFYSGLVSFISIYFTNGKYNGSLLTFAVLCLAVSLSLYVNLEQMIILRLNKFSVMSKIYTFQLLFNIVAAFLLIPTFGALGAGVSVLATRCSGLVLTKIYLKKCTRS